LISNLDCSDLSKKPKLAVSAGGVASNDHERSIFAGICGDDCLIAAGVIPDLLPTVKVRKSAFLVVRLNVNLEVSA
jgi:hypothetical protein